MSSELSADPLEWLGTRLSDLDTVAADAGLAPGEIGAADGARLRRAVPEILDAVRRLLAQIRATPSPPATADQLLVGARVGWL